MHFYKCVVFFVRHAGLSGVAYTVTSILKSSINVLRLLLLQRMISEVSAWIGARQIAPDSLIFSIGAFAASYLLDSTLDYACVRLDTKCEWELTINLHKSLYEKFLRLRYEHYEEKTIYNSISKMSDDVAVQMKEAFVSCLTVCNLFISVAGLSVIFIQVSIPMACSLLLVIAFAVLFSIKGMNMLNQIKYKQSEDERMLDYYMSLLTDKTSLLELIIFHARTFILRRRIDKEKTVVRELYKKSIRAGLVYNISTIIIVVWLILALLYCSRQLLEGGIDIALFVVVIQSSLTLLSSMEDLSYQVADSTKRVHIFKYYDDFVRLSEMELPSTATPLPAHISVQFEHVTFRYPGTNKDVLSNVSFRLDATTKYAIVGENGAGKSTIVKLIFGLFQAQQGNVTVDTENVGIVYQDFMRYAMSIRENVAMGNISLLDRDKEIMELMEVSGISEITRQTDGIDKKLGQLYPDSLDLSGGQWQRLAIARGLASAKSFIVLDEPTASMDPIAESQMYETFLRSHHDRGSLIISHRLASARLADYIFVMKDHTICEQGSHIELMKANGYYSELYRKQAAWYE